MKKTQLLQMNQTSFLLAPKNEEDASKKIMPSDVQLFLRKRYYVIGMALIGFILNFLLRINLSICIVDMTTDKIINSANQTIIKPAEYNWTTPEKGFILSAFSWGLLFAPIGVLVVDRFGGATVFGYTLFFTGCLTLLSPAIISAGIHIFLFVRTLEGLSEGITSVALYSIFVQWVPQNERSRLINVVYSGIPTGSMISYVISGVISYSLGWKYVFYITGGGAITWFFIWKLTISNSPTSDRFITTAEKKYLSEVTKSGDASVDKVVHPWKSVLTSKAVLAYLNERFVESWSLSFLTYCLPLYIKDIYSVNVKDIGFLSSIPHFFSVCSYIAGSWLQDCIRAKGITSKTRFHKSFILFGQTVAVASLIIAGSWIEFYVSMVAFCIFRIGFSVAEVSYYVLPVEMGLKHSNLLMSLSMTSLSLGYFLNPIIMGYMVQNHLKNEWSRYFIFLCVFNLWGAFIFARYGSGEVQSWAEPGDKKKRIASCD